MYLSQNSSQKEISTQGAKAFLQEKYGVKAAQIMPLSFNQRTMWMMQQLNPDNPAYNISLGIYISSVIDITTMQKALQLVFDHHPMLRTAYASVDGELFQIVYDSQTLVFEVIDATTWDANTLSQQIEIDVKRPFCLEKGYVLRAILYVQNENSYVLQLSMHHIAGDGWSSWLILQGLQDAYESIQNGIEASLSKPLSTYEDFVSWQADLVSSEKGEELWSFWEQELAGELPILDLPTDYHPTQKNEHKNAAYRFSLDSELTGKLRQLAHEEHATLYKTLLTAFQIFLWRYSGQEDSLICTPVLGRSQMEYLSVVGFFVNTVVMRGQIDSQKTFRAQIQDTNENVKSALAHLDFPFSLIVERLYASRNEFQVPLTQFLFNLVRPPQGLHDLFTMSMDTIGEQEFKLGPFTISGLNIHSGQQVEGFNLSIDALDFGNRVVADLKYSCDLYEQETIARMVTHFQTLLANIVANPDLPIAELSLMPDTEQEKLESWNKTVVSLPADQFIHTLIAEKAQQTPTATAVVFQEQALTYQELNEQANQLAHHLRSLGVGPDKRVGIAIERSCEMIVALLGILKAGGAYVPFDPTYPKARLVELLADAEPHVFVTQQALVAQFPIEDVTHDMAVVLLDSDAPQIKQQSQQNPVTLINQDNLAYIIYTSGSTGKPKGVMLPHRAVLNHNLVIVDQYELVPSDRVWQFSTINFDIAVEEIFPTLICGATLVLRDPDIPSPNQLAQVVEKDSLTVLLFPTAYWAQWANELFISKTTLPDCLRLVSIGGEKTEKASYEQWQQVTKDHHVVWLNTYGPTETAVISTLYRPTGDVAQEVPIGKAIANTKIYILDANQQQVPIGLPGELYIGGVGVARGYFNRPDLTAERFLPDPFAPFSSDTEPPRLFKTGDLVRYLPDGNIEFLGRTDYQVKIRGYRVEPGEVEAVLLQHPDIKQTAVTTLPDSTNKNQLIAYLVPQKGAAPTRTDLRQFLQEKLPEYMIPSVFITLEEMPLTPNGKFDRKALPKPENLSVDLEQHYVAPRTPQEKLLCDIWAQILQVNQVGIYDNFFELGGHSLLATQVVSRVEKAVGVTLRLGEIFKAPTVAKLSELVNQARRTDPLIQPPPMKRVSRDSLIPLSYSQERMWFLHQLAPDSYAYNIPLPMIYRQPINRDVLQTVLDELVIRHETLRTIFPIADGVPRQEILPPFPVTIHDFDLSTIPAEDQENAVEQMIQEDTKRPYNLASDPAWHFFLFYLNDNCYVLYFAFHHIISDQWSAMVLWQDFNTLYQAHLHGETPELPALDIQYADFSVWQRDWLQGDTYDAIMTYWRSQLANVPTLDMPTDHPRPPVQTFSGATGFLELSPDLTNALRTLSQQAHVSPFMLMLASFKILLAKYTGQSDFAIGVPVANRQYMEIEPLLGTFVNTLVIRLDLEDDPTFAQLLRTVRDTLLDAYAYQELPFEKLVNEIVEERDLSQTPLVQVLFNMTNSPFDHDRMEADPVSFMTIDREAAQFDISVSLVMEEHLPMEPLIMLEYNSALYEPETIERFLAHYEALLGAVVNDSNKPVSHYELLSEKEKHQLITTWNQTQMTYPQNGLHELFVQQARNTPLATAVSFNNQSLTYQELDRRSNQLARHLQKLGVGPEIVVGVFVERSLEMVVGLLAILKAGGAYLPLDPGFPADRLSFMVEDAAVDVILTQADLVTVSPADQVAHPVCLDTEWEQIAQESSESLPATSTPENRAYIIYTSGSTGKPKGVQIEHRNVVNFLTAMQQEPGITAEDILFSVTTLSFDISILEIFLPLVTGAQIVIADRLTAVDGRELIKAINQTQATILQATPTTWSMLIEAGWKDTPSLRLALCGGEAMSRELANGILKRDIELWNMYGPTETTIWSSVQRISPNQQQITIGKPIGNNTFHVLDPMGRPVPIGVAGELHIGGDGVARGYLNRPELTAERFLPDSFTSWSSTKRLYRTGDLARYLADGTVEYLGRLDFQVKIHGHRIELGEIEAVISEHPHVREIVVTVHNNEGDQIIVGYILPHEDIERPTITTLREYLRGHLPDYMIPSAFVYLTEFPLTPNRKIDRKALPAPDSFRPDLESTYVAPRNDVEIVLTDILADLLGLEKVGIRDDFFELGGHSLQATRYVARISKVFRTEVPLWAFLRSPNIADMTEQLDSVPERERIMKIAKLRVKMASLSQEEVQQLLQKKNNA